MSVYPSGGMGRNGACMVSVRSTRDKPLREGRGGGSSAGSPSSAPPSAHATNNATSSSVSDQLLWYVAQHGAAKNGGIVWLATLSASSGASRIASDGASSENGAIPPLVWQPTQADRKSVVEG